LIQSLPVCGVCGLTRDSATIPNRIPTSFAFIEIAGRSMFEAAPVAQFDIHEFASQDRFQRKHLQLSDGDLFFSQGQPANAIFFLLNGRVRLSVVSVQGKEVTISILLAGNFIGEEALPAVDNLRSCTAAAINPCSALRLERTEMIQCMLDSPAFANFFMRFLLLRSMKTQADLVDQLFNSSEKRLARTLLLMAEFGKPGEPHCLIPPITQQTLAEMIGTTRSRVSFFMNRFRKLGYIEYNGRIKVHKSLLNVVLLDPASGHESSPWSMES